MHPAVTLFYESVDRITLIARRVKLPRGRLLSSDLLECVAWLVCVGSRTENRAYTRQVVFSSLRVIVGRVIRSYGRIDAHKRTHCERTVGR